MINDDLTRWVNKEINIVVDQLKQMSRYQKARSEGYLSALKKVQNQINIYTVRKKLYLEHCPTCIQMTNHTRENEYMTCEKCGAKKWL